MKPQHFKVVSCNVMWRELCYYAALSPNAFSLQFLPWGLHCEPDNLRREVQQAVDATDGSFDATLLGYGLCSKGVEGIVARDTRLVIVKGHDCITHFLGSKDRYRDYFDRNPGTYWYSPGWIENHLSPGEERYEVTYRNYVEKFGEDNAQYLMEMEQDWFRKYTTAAYVDLRIGNSSEYEAFTQHCADWLKWKFDRLEGDARLIHQLVNGDWNHDEFLIVEPGHKIEATNDHDIMRAVPSER
ncbi:MAG: DUF1638 domain-containing protein [Armatimonadetes bacterium]|nr:DUF1638 domain-containing protein [Armatimonadota bacterium]